MISEILTLTEAAERLRVEELAFWANNIPRNLPDEPRVHVPIRRSYSKKPGPRSLHQAERQRRVKQATPKWFDAKAVLRLYLHAQRLSKRRKEKYHVDHIIPIWHPEVCGLHTHQNMQVITERRNAKKGNRFSVRWQR